jgi:hypothetical protein
MIKKLLYSFLFFALSQTTIFAATYYSRASGNWNSNLTWSLTSGGAAVGAGIFPGLNDTVFIENSNVVTATVNAQAAVLNFNGNNVTLTVNSGVVVAITGAINVTSSASSDRTPLITGSGTLTSASLVIGTDGNPANNTTIRTELTSTIANLTISGNLTVSSFVGSSNTRIINSGFYLQSGIVDLGGQIVTTNENAVNTATVSTATGAQTGTFLLASAGSSFTITGTGTSSIVLNGTNATVNYDRSGTQTVRPTTYTNLTLSGTSAKTTTTVTVNGVLSLEGSATASVALTYGAAATLQYNTTANRTAGVEWPATFSGSGGVVVKNTGDITLNNAKNITNGFSIASGGKVNLGTFTHTVGSLILNGSSTVAGSWGSTTSTAVNKNSTYFDTAGTGLINVGCTFNFANVAPITYVRLNTLNNPSSASTSSPAYEDFASSSSTTLIRGQSYTISVNGNTYNGNYNFYYTAFVDWNQDGDFDDAGEYYAIGTISNSSGSDGKLASVYFPIPTGAVLGNTRMRVISHYNSYNTTPCSSVDGNSYGQVEDYLITVQDVCAAAPAPGDTVSTSASVCPNTPFTLSLQNPPADGATFVWQTSPDGNNPWTNALPTPTTFFSSTFSTPQSANTTVGDISLYGNDTSITGGELFLTQLNGSYYGGFVVQKTPGTNINPFTVTFDYKIYGGSGADGFSLSYASNVANSAGNGESGEGSGIIVQFDTYDNEGVATGSRVRVLYNSVALFNSAINVPFNLRTTTPNNVVLTVDSSGKLSLSIAGTTVVSNLILPAGYLSADKSNWKFKFGARTGGSTDIHSIDNLTINYLDVTSTNPTLTTTQTVPTYYRALVTCGTTVASNPVLVNVTSAVINPMTASVCTGLAFTVTPVNGTNGTIPSGTTYSWTAPTVTGAMTGGTASTGTPTSISGTLVNPTGTAQTATYTVTPTSGTCTGTPFTLTVTVNPSPAAPTASATTQPTCSVSTGTITVTAPTGTGISYSINGTDYTNTNGIFTGVAVGTYNVTTQNSTGCLSPATVVVINAPTVKTWTGTSGTGWSTATNWSPNGVPTASDCVVIPNVTNQPVIATANGFAQILTVNNGASLSVLSAYTLTVADAITVGSTGSLVFENHSSLLQSNSSSAINSGNITYKRISPQIRRGDFVYWSAPVTPQKLIDVSPLTLSDKYFGFDGNNWVETNPNNTMLVGKGYIIRAPSTYSITVKADYAASFVGVPNNGNLSGETLLANKNYLIGNPYPSALDANTFLAANGFLDGTLYFWTHNTPVNLSGIYNYDANDYAAYNVTGGTATYAAPSGSIPGNNNSKPTGKIAAGQSFFASSNAAGTVVFNNSMRLGATDNTQFFKQDKSATATNRVWLNMTSQNGLFKQMLVGYVAGASNDYENRYDGVTLDGNPYLDFYSFNNGNKYVIQGRGLPFLDTDTVPLGYRTTVEGEFTIAIDETDGDLSSQNIYLEDKTTGKIQDLKAANYTFQTAIGTFTDRFVLRYTNKTLGVGDIENLENNVLVAVKDKVVKVTSTKENIKQVTLFDVSGKLLYDKNKVGTTELQLQNLPLSNQVLLVNITLENGFVTTKKIIFK